MLESQGICTEERLFAMLKSVSTSVAQFQSSVSDTNNHESNCRPSVVSLMWYLQSVDSIEGCGTA